MTANHFCCLDDSVEEAVSEGVKVGVFFDRTLLEHLFAQLDSTEDWDILECGDVGDALETAHFLVGAEEVVVAQVQECLGDSG